MLRILMIVSKILRWAFIIILGMTMKAAAFKSMDMDMNMQQKTYGYVELVVKVPWLVWVISHT